MNTFFKIVIIVLLLPIAFIAFSFIGILFVVKNEARVNAPVEVKSITKQQAEKELTNTIDVFVLDKVTNKYTAIQNYFDDMPDDLKVSPQDDTITTNLKEAKRQRYIEDVFSKIDCIEFIFRDSYLGESTLGSDNKYFVSLEIPRIVRCVINGQIVKLDMECDSGKAVLVSRVKNDNTGVFLKDIDEDEIRRLLKNGNRLRIRFDSSALSNIMPLKNLTEMRVLLFRCSDIQVIGK